MTQFAPKLINQMASEHKHPCDTSRMQQRQLVPDKWSVEYLDE